MRGLTWRITESNLPHVDLFFSPHLREISIFISGSFSRRNLEIRPDILPVIASAISTLPTSTLQVLFVDYSNHGVPWAYFKDTFSSIALRCGPSLTEFTSPVPLSSAAVNHLIRLPHLHTWRVEGPPPRYSASSLPTVFPPLTKFTLGEWATRQWLSLFERMQRGVPATQGVTPLFKAKESLTSLRVEELDPLGYTIDVSFIAAIKIFRNLVHLDVAALCYRKGEGHCIFKLNNKNVSTLAMALPRLESFLLGYPCFENTCSTTVACLLLISVHCLKLQKLEIHFNTTNIVNDLKDISRNPRFQELLPLPRCPLLHLKVSQTPLALDEPDFETVANGMLDIFPSLIRCEGHRKVWYDISGRINELQKMRTTLERRW